MTSGNRLVNAIEKGNNLQERYNLWEKELERMIIQCFEKEKKKKELKTPRIRKMMAKRRTVKKELLRNPTPQLIDKCNRLEENIRTEKWKDLNQNMAREIKSIEDGGGIESGAFWEFLKRMEGKKVEKATAILGKDKTLKTDKEEIKEEFRTFYTNLFQQEEIEDQMSRELVDLRIKVIETKTKRKIAQKPHRSKITQKDVEQHIKRLKNKTTVDKQGTNNIIIKNGGKDLVESLTKIFIEIDNLKVQPNQWMEMIVNSVYKNKGDRKDLENRRGLFITNSISKLYDKVKMDKNKDKFNSGISKFQVGGMSGKGTVDHTMTLDAVINYNKLMGSETYILFADAYKCFDKLNLKDCICDISEIIGEIMYAMNKKGKATIKTPVGMVENITADNIVRQGTIPGPKLCVVNTDKINKTGRKSYTYIGPRVRIETLAFVDDLQNASTSITNVVNTAKNLSTFERTKGYTFSIDEKKTAILIAGKKKNKTYEINAEVMEKL